MAYTRPMLLELPEGVRERGWSGVGETPATVIEIDGHRLIGPGGGNDQINSVITIDILGQNPQAARRSHKFYGLPACSAELQIDGVDGTP